MAKSEADKSPRHWFKRRLCQVGVVLLCLAVAGVLLLRWHWRAEFSRRVEAIRAAGFPATGKELNSWYPWPPSGENAAYWITEALASWRQPTTSEESRVLQLVTRQNGHQPRPAAPLPAELTLLLEQYVGDNAKTLQGLHEAAAIAECRYPVDFSDPCDFPPHLPMVEDAGLLLSVEALLRAQNQDAAGAALAVEAALRVAQSLEREPTLGSYILRLETARSGALALVRVLNQVALTEEQLTHLQKVFEGVDTNEGLLRALVGIRCLLVERLKKPQAIKRESFNPLPPVPLLEAYVALGLSAREGVLVLDYMDECLRIARLPLFERPAAISALEARFHGRKGIYLGDLISGGILDTRPEEVWIQLAATALAVERYRLAHGSAPETLSQLVPGYLAAVPPDPFDGTPLRYKSLDHGFMVYSVGENGKDDGGVEESSVGANGPGQTGDLVFRVERL